VVGSDSPESCQHSLSGSSSCTCSMRTQQYNKDHYTHLTCTPDHCMQHISTAVPVLKEVLTSSHNSPLVVGIPVKPNALLLILAASLFQCIQHSKHIIHAHNPPFPTACCCIQASFHCHTSGCISPRPFTNQLQPSLNTLFRALLQAPTPDHSAATLSNPIPSGGRGCPLL
jgi:hypothetical protein